MTTPATHRLRPMTGRDPREAHRTATPLELLYDLTLVVAFSVAGTQAAHLVAEGHWVPGLAGFSFTVFAAVWAWINYSWFASAYDTDDWMVRLAALLQMIGVVLLTLGVPALFAGFDDGWQLHNEVMVAGYVVMRIPLVALWLRAAHADPAHAPTASSYAATIALAQVGWVALIPFRPPVQVWLPCYLVLFALEIGGPLISERRFGPAPWHPHHIAERYSLLVIIALGEGVVGTVLAVESLISVQGWSVDAVVLAVGGLALTMGLWWIYFSVPFGELLDQRPGRAFTFGYGHIVLLGTVAAVGAGLHVAAYRFEGVGHLSPVFVVAATAVPVALTWLVVLWMYHSFVPGWDPVHVADAVGTAVTIGASVALAAAGVDLALCLAVLMLAPWVTVLGFEFVGHRYTAANMARLDGED